MEGNSQADREMMVMMVRVKMVMMTEMMTSGSDDFWWGLLLMEGNSQADRATPQAQRTDPAPVHWDRKMMRLIKMMMMMTSSS